MKTRTEFVCTDCGAVSARWLGRCRECGAWNTLEERAQPARAAPERRSRAVDPDSNAPVRLADVSTTQQARLQTGIAELDRVLGGGLVRGSVALLGGEPGMGKSTLLLQALASIGASAGKVLYVTGEESARQIRLRADRLGIGSDDLLLLCESETESILAHLRETQPRAVVIDSIQTASVETVRSAPGSVAQIRESAAAFIAFAKSSETPVFLVGHVTKEGTIAGPRVLEHMVDTVLMFEGDLHHAYRLIRATKNRFGSTNELAVFEMTERGLAEVANPSALFLSQRTAGVSGSVVVCALEGSRPLLLELQALVAPARYGAPMRVSTGFDRSRVAMLLAVLEKRGGIALQNADVFVNVTGGVELDEPAADLGMVAAIASNYRDAPVSPKTVLLGEVGLAGEVRAVSRLPQRLAEAAKLGFERAVVPKSQAAKSASDGSGGIQVVGVDTVGQALGILI